MKKAIILLAVLVITLSACVSTGSIMDKDGVYIIEAEKMTLTGCEINEKEEASGGKAAKVLSDDASGSFELSLPAGEYLVNPYINAPDGDHDAFYLIADDTHVKRTYPSKHNQWTYCSKYLIFKAENSGTHTIKFSVNWPGEKPGETGMYVDKLELVSVEKSAPVLEKWLY